MLAVGSGFAASQDRLHGAVVGNRFNDEHQLDWQLQGYALPILVPAVADTPWEEIVALRKDKGLQHLRGVLAEIEAETMEIAVNGGDSEQRFIAPWNVNWQHSPRSSKDLGVQRNAP